MKKAHIFVWLFLFIAIVTSANNKETTNTLTISEWLKAGPIELKYPAFHQTEDVSNKTFKAKDLIKANYLDLNRLTPSEDDHLIWESQKTKWQKVILSQINKSEKRDTKSPQMNYFICYLSASQWIKAKLKIDSHPLMEVYLDGKLVAGCYENKTDNSGMIEEELTLEQKKHTLIIKTLSTGESNQFNVTLTPETPFNRDDITLSLSPKRHINIRDIVDGIKIKGASISPNGNMSLLSFSFTSPSSGKTEIWKEIREIKSGKIIYSFRRSDKKQIKWLPKGNSISFITSMDKNTNIYVLDLDRGTETLLGENIQNFGSYHWSPDTRYVIYSETQDHSEDWKLRKLKGMEDRLPDFRTRSFLFKLDVESRIAQRLTHGTLSTNLHDISSDGKNIIFSQNRPDYEEYPYHKQNLYMMDINSFKVDTIWKDKLFSGYARFSPDGKKILVKGGPSCFGKIGENIGKQILANNYDGQLYILDPKTNKVDPITYDFAPSVMSAIWNKKDGDIYIKANNEDYISLFRYSPKDRSYTTIPTGVDVVKSFDIASNSLDVIFTGCSISTPYKAYVLNLSDNKRITVAEPEKEDFENVIFGKTEDWNFTKKDGQTIIGRVYYPPNFDPQKRYPLIVNYYAGTAPVERRFGGRYPLNLYAANGYVVYLLQPSGAIGFGQEFSAAHQNNWGKTTADEIIEGTTKFLKSHSFIDPDRVGCIGASYGGFMTMYLQTRTDIFAAAISHAGISSISSYWGEGYWGYSYSTNASGYSFPWNNRELYIEQSPLFNADKIQTPILLLHGSVDTNVPPGESIQLYQALKLLGRDVEFVLVKDQDHHIIDYTKRLLWNNTIFAYFAKYLKKQPLWWSNMYPDKNL